MRSQHEAKSSDDTEFLPDYLTKKQLASVSDKEIDYERNLERHINNVIVDMQQAQEILTWKSSVVNQEPNQQHFSQQFLLMLHRELSNLQAQIFWKNLRLSSRIIFCKSSLIALHNNTYLEFASAKFCLS